jgi:phage baseplate assembly protein W
MTTPFERTAPPTRWIETQQGETLWAVAARVLGDPERWYELVYLNDLVSPYLTDDPAAVTPGVLLTGSSLKVPGTDLLVVAADDPVAVFGTDIRLYQGRLMLTDATETQPLVDVATVAGTPNLTQAIRLVIDTEIGEAVFHPQYGCGAHTLIGQRETPERTQFAAALVRRAIAADARIARVDTATVSLTGDVLRADVTATAISGATINVVSN